MPRGIFTLTASSPLTESSLLPPSRSPAGRMVFMVALTVGAGRSRCGDGNSTATPRRRCRMKRRVTPSHRNR